MNLEILLIDTNLLLLYVVGTASRHYISTHKRLTSFLSKDFDVLLDLMKKAKTVLVTPNTLTETSNLAMQIPNPARTHIASVLRDVIHMAAELYVPSKTASARQEFVRLGMTDSALLEALTTDVALLTVDLDLYVAALKNHRNSINFNHLREVYL